MLKKDIKKMKSLVKKLESLVKVADSKDLIDKLQTLKEGLDESFSSFIAEN